MTDKQITSSITNTKNIYLFTDGSVNPQKKIGYGAYFTLYEEELSLITIEPKINTKKFLDTSSTKLELETLLWALRDEVLQNYHIVIYTDCQNILGLESRREGFEENAYYTKKQKLIKNHELYKEFYKAVDELSCKFIKVKGHKVQDQKDHIDKLFTLVDKASRIALREDMSKLPN